MQQTIVKQQEKIRTMQNIDTVHLPTRLWVHSEYISGNKVCGHGVEQAVSPALFKSAFI